MRHRAAAHSQRSRERRCIPGDKAKTAQKSGGMGSLKLGVVLSIACLLLTACGHTPTALQPPQAEKGILDLRAWDFARDGALSLAGEWEFYWAQLVDPAALAAGRPQLTGLIQLPASWNGYNVDGQALSGDGFATYHLEILLDAAHPPALAFKMPEFETAYVLYVNGQVISANGSVGKTPATMQPQWLPRIARFTAESDRVQVLLQISNFHHRKGGAGQKILLGAESNIRDVRERQLNFEFWLFGSLFIMGLYHAGLFAFRRKDPSPLYFGLCCFLMAIRILVTGEYYLSQAWPTLSWEWVVRLNYLSFGLMPPIFVAYTRVLFREVSVWSQRAQAVGATVFGVLVLATPARVFTHFLLPYQMLVLATAAYFSYALFLAVKRKRAGVLIFLAGFGVLLATMLNDILNSNNIIRTGYMGPFGTWAFIFAQAVLLARRFSTAFFQVETLSQELEQRVIARTQRLAMVAALGEHLNTILDPDELLAEVVNRAKMRFNYYHVQIFLLDESGTVLELAKGYGQIGEEMKRQGSRLELATAQSLIARSAREKQVIVVQDVRLEASWLYHPSLPNTLAEIAAPMILNDQVLGVLDVQQDCVAGLDEGDAHLLRLLASQAAVALTNARLFAQAQQRAAELAQAKAWAEERSQAAEAANRAKSVFLANMSHELRTPLNAVLGFTQLMIYDSNLTDEQREDLSIVGRSGEHLLALINDVLEMSKIEAGRVELHVEKFDLRYMLQGLVEMFRLRAEQKGLYLMSDIAPDIPDYIRADEAKLRQVLINLLGNAVKFTHEGSVTLRVGSRQQEVGSREHEVGSREYEVKRVEAVRASSSDFPIPSSVPPTPYSLLQFEVEDTGVGIADEEQAMLFDAFAQTSSGRQSGEGTGLGLRISQQYVHIMGGQLRFVSVPGQGSCFTFELPLLPADAPENLDDPATAALPAPRQIIGLSPGQHAPDGGSYRVLVVEDVAANRKLLRDLLHSWRPDGDATPVIEVREALNGQEAVALWEQWRPHLIWMDIQMPVLDGYAATRQIRAQAVSGVFPTPIIVALTASVFEEERVQTMVEGCDDFVRKPFQQGEICAVLEKHLGLRFVYAEPENGDEDSNTSLSLSDFSVSSEWKADMRKAAIQGDIEWMMTLVEQVKTPAPPLAEQLRRWIGAFEHGKILELLEPVPEAK